MSSKQIISKTAGLLHRLDAFDLPTDKYVITGSGPLSIRGIRMMSDIDIGVATDLWDTLAKKFPITEEEGVTKIRLANDIELFYDGSFSSPMPGAPTITDQVNQAEVIDGYPFQSLEQMIWFKKNSGREKDLKDITLINKWRVSQK